MISAQFAMWILCGIGIALAIGYLCNGMSRSYLLFLGVAFLLVGLTFCTPKALRWLVQLLAGAAFIYALVESVADTKLRLRKFREAQQEREAAFAEYLRALAEQDAPEKVTIEPGP